MAHLSPKLVQKNLEVEISLDKLRDTMQVISMELSNDDILKADKMLNGEDGCSGTILNRDK